MMATPATNQSRFKNLWAGYGAALWALIFAALHVVWAAGWYIGLQEEQARRAFQQTWFLVYDLVAAMICALGVIVALAFVQLWGQHLSRRLLSIFAWCGTGLLVLRGAAGIIKIIYLAAIGRSILDPMALWDVWFCLGAVLFSLMIWQFRHVNYI